MSEFDPAVEAVLWNEGGLVDNENDHGSITNYGISYRLYKSLHPNAVENDIRDLTIEEAKHIYFHEFWENTRFDELKIQVIANVVFDTAVNCGLARAVKTLQRAYNATKGSYNAIADDGVLGPKTLGAVNNISFVPLRAAFRAERAGYYRCLVVANSSQEVFLRGWLTRAYST